MRLISCEYCGTVIDTDRIIEEDIYDHDTYEVIEDNARYNQDSDRWEAIIKCSACESIIFYRNGDLP